MCQTVVRQPLPMRRKCITQKIRIGGQTVHYSVGLYADGSPGELFIEVSKAGSALRQWCGDMSRMMSVALQHGTPLLTTLNLFIGTRCDPCGEVKGHDYITYSTSIMDTIARDMAITFLQRLDLADVIDCNKPLLLERYTDARRSNMDTTRGLSIGTDDGSGGIETGDDSEETKQVIACCKDKSSNTKKT